MNSWRLTTSEPAPELLYLANGYMGISLPWDGGVLQGSERALCYLRGVYNGSGEGGIDRLADIPCWTLLQYCASAKVEEYYRELDLRRGVLTTMFLLEEARGRVRLRHTIFLSRSDLHQAAVRIAIVPEFDGPIMFNTHLETSAEGDMEYLDAGGDERMLHLRCQSRTHGIIIAQTAIVEEDCWDLKDSSHAFGVSRGFEAAGRTGQEITLTQLVRMATSLEGPDPMSRARASGGRLVDIAGEHERAWARLWQTNIEIDGDPDVQRFARAGLFYLWSTMLPDDHWSIAPMGLSSNGYNGHIFWDTELWMYPSLLVTQPEMAHSCVAYRRRTLPAARARALSNGHTGAQFPWEAAFTGEEMTPFWCDTRDYQLHITADVAIAQWWFYLNTMDVEWLRQEGFPVMRACAEYWASRVEYSAERDRYEISDVVCADEYAVHVNNDAFTNAAVRQALMLTIRAGELVGETVPSEWRVIADRIYIPYDRANGRHVEFDGYAGQVTKQADVELLAYPLEYTTDPIQVARDLDYYATVIDPDGPAMSFSIYSIVSAQLGRAAAAYDYLKRSYVPNTRAPFFSFSETPLNDEFYFCTGVGGALQSLLFGFTGLRLREGYFVLNPILPDHWRALRLSNLFIAGARVDIEVALNSLVVRSHLEDGTVTIEMDQSQGTVYLRGVKPTGCICTVSGRSEAQPWQGRATHEQPFVLPEQIGSETRVQVTADGHTLIDFVVLTRLATPAHAGAAYQSRAVS